MTLEQLNTNESHLLFKCISGSHAYGLALPTSDTDIKGVYVLPKVEFYGLHFTDQINNVSNDIMYYEVKKFIELILKNNPNMLELLNTPDECVLHKHPLMDLIEPSMFLSKLCNQTFGQYAYAQIKKALGLNKKILNPIDKKRKGILDFCYVVQGHQSVPAIAWLHEQQFKQEECGLVRIDHIRDIYALYHQSQTDKMFLGIYANDKADDVRLSSVPAGLTPKAILHFNKDGYSMYCKEYRQYWDWVNDRNDERYETTVSHGKNYDSKNMMHVFRLLNMAEEIALYNKVIVRRKEGDWLLRIRAGEFLYEDLVKQAEEKIQKVDELFKKSDLPEAPATEVAEKLLVRIRGEFYN
jgi:uncharacterized protein